MDIRILDQDENGLAGAITLEVSLELEDLAQLKEDALRALEIERALPVEARTEFGGAEEPRYVSQFIETRATNDALEIRNIVPVAAPHVSTAGIASGDLYTCTVRVLPRPEIELVSLDPVNLKTRRVAKPGFSAKLGEEGDESVEFVDDEKVLRSAMIERLDSELPENCIRALADEYQEKFEKELFKHNIDPESYQLAHGLNEEQYLLMMARRALNDAHWNYALDAIYVGMDQTVTKDALVNAFDEEFPGYGEQLFDLYDLRNELYKPIEKVRRAWSLEWLRANALK